jgi:hypothetical protein
MVRAGGLFISIMGVGVILGGVFPGQRKSLLSLGGVTATMAITLFAHELTRPLGLPTSMQVGALYGAMLLEPISKSFQDRNRGQLNKSEEILRVVFPPTQEAALPLQPRKEAFHDSAPLAAAKPAAILGFLLHSARTVRGIMAHRAFAATL